MSEISPLKYTLGLDLGSASCGWAAVELDGNDDPVRLVAAGVRIFDPGVVGGESEIQKGKDKSKASERRLARHIRRQTHRRALRQKKLFCLLQEHRLLPSDTGLEVGLQASQRRHEIINALDQRLSKAWRGKATIQGVSMDLADQSLVYMIRAAAVTERIELCELGRILYHLAQRRGYWSNRLDSEEPEQAPVEDESDTPGPASAKKASRKQKREEPKDSPGEVAKGISTLRAEMKSAGAQYLGSYFAMLNPHEKRIRHRWTERSMFIEEFAAIWKTQREFHPDILTDDLEAKVRYWLFFQRPLASSNHLIGFCELEKGERRAPWATLEAQRFRLLQKVNDLRLIEQGVERPLKKHERDAIVEHLETKGDLTFSGLKKLLGSPSIEGCNLERGSKDKIEGNRVNVAMLEVFGSRWNELSLEEKRTAVEQWRTIRSEERAVTVAIEKWRLDENAAKKWAHGARPPKDYCRLSRVALAKVLPRMESGTAFKTVERDEYGPRHSGGNPMPLVPKVVEYLPSINNPAVVRALTEMRKVVNAIIREYGKPFNIRIELARELRKNRHERERLVSDAKDRQEKREKAARQILAAQHRINPSAQDIRDVPHYMIEKWLLAEECHWVCPYTNQQINYAKLFQHPEFEVEHIIPLSQCSDNSFVNKTLCHRDENQKKGGKTPWQAYHADEQRWAQILDRVSKFANGPKKGEHPKLRRFKLRTTEEVEGFTRRQLADTRYTSKLAARLLMALYGGRDTVLAGDEDTSEFFDMTGRRIFASTGGVTHLLRDAWMLHPNVVLGLAGNGQKPNGKDRSDHRHHAVDALVIALTTEKQVQQVILHAKAKQDQKWPLNYRDLVRGLKSPWNDRERFLGNVFQKMLVSHRPEHKIAASLHKEGNYGKEHGRTKTGKPLIHERIMLKNLNPRDISFIVDDAVRNAVETFFTEIVDLKKWAPEKHGYPYLVARNQRHIPIKKVRIRYGRDTTAVGVRQKVNGSALDNRRHVDASAKNHVAIFVSRKVSGKAKRLIESWLSECVSVLETHNRIRNGLPVIHKKLDKHPEAEFLYSLKKGDTVELEVKNITSLYLLTSIEADGRINFVPINAAGKREDQGHIKVREQANTLRTMNIKPVFIDLLGKRHYIQSFGQ